MKNGSYNRDIFHGGDLDAAKAIYGHDEPPWIDLSTGINPTPYPIPAISQQAWTRLPSSALETAMLTAAKSYYGAQAQMPIVAASGTQSLIQLLPSLVAHSTVAILSPTYNEHQNCWSQAGHRVIEISTLSDLPVDCNHCVIVSPNNPTGKDYTPEELGEAAKTLHQRGGYLIVDEAFKDVTATDSLVWVGPANGVVIFKSFGKFFGLAGLRLGFALGDPEMIKKLQDTLGPWAVSGIAMEVAIAAFSDAHWIKKTRLHLSENRLRLDKMLSFAGFQIEGGTDLFTYAHHDNSLQIFETLCAQHILTRPFQHDPKKLRFGHPANEHEWQRLDAALKST